MATTKIKITANRNRHTARVVAALVQLGFFDFTIEAKEDYCIIDVKKFNKCQYSHIEVYESGYIYYLLYGKTLFEGVTKRISTIKKDILHQPIITS